MIIAILLEKVFEAVKDEFSEFGHTVPEQKAIIRQSQPVPQTVETKQTAATEAVATPTPVQEQQAQTTAVRITPKTMIRAKAEVL